MSKKITMTLDPASIQRAAREIRQYRQWVENRIIRLMHGLVQAGIIEAETQLTINGSDSAFDGFDTGQLANSIRGAYDPKSRTGFIMAGEGLGKEFISGKEDEDGERNSYYFNYAFAVEYGTGFYGATSPHPDRKYPLGYDGVWLYDMGGHGEDGWIYPTGEVNEKGNPLYTHTRGRPAIPFMYNTAKSLQEYCKKLSKELFGHV